MQDIYNEIEEEDDEEEKKDDNELTKSAYKNLIGRLFRGYTFFNFGIVLLLTSLSVDIFAGGGNITIAAPLTARIGEYAPTFIAYKQSSLINAAFNTISIFSIISILIGARLIRKGHNRAAGVSLDKLTITDTDEQEQERLIRQQGYINRGRQFIPIAIIAGIVIGAGIAYLFGEATGIVGLTILLS